MDSDILRNINSFLRNVYSDEPIRRTKREKQPAIIQAIRAIECIDMGYWQSREAIFVKQGKLLANYDDDYEFSGDIHKYYPTYQSLTDRELRGYLSWRTKLRRGELQPGPSCFAFLYVYELLNGIGCSDPIDGYNKLVDFYNSYEYDGRVVQWYMDGWLRDFVVYNNLPHELLDGDPRIEADLRLLALINADDAGKLMDSMIALSSYRVEKSRYYKSAPEDFAQVTMRVWRKMAEYYDKKRKKSLVEDYFGDKVNRPVSMFHAAVFHDPGVKRTFDYKLDDICIYHCVDGRWRAEFYEYNGSKSKKLGSLLRTIDSIMREINGCKYPTKPDLSVKWITKLITEECETYKAEKREAEKKRIDFDMSLLSGIRQDAAITRDRLIVDEEEPFEDDEPKETSIADTGDLSEDEYRLMQCLLYGMPTDWVKSRGLMLSVMTDSINEKLFDDFGDTVLDGEKVIEDYIDELKERIKP